MLCVRTDLDEVEAGILESLAGGVPGDAGGAAAWKGRDVAVFRIESKGERRS
jgi:hypothetical protein